MESVDQTPFAIKEHLGINALRLQSNRHSPGTPESVLQESSVWYRAVVGTIRMRLPEAEAEAVNGEKHDVASQPWPSRLHTGEVCYFFYI